MRWRALVAALSVTLALAGCGDDKRPAVTDGDEYTGPPQVVTAKRVDEPVVSVRPKYKTETYCKTKNTNGSCKTYATRRVADGIETYESDDRDWVLVLADGTEVDVDQAEYDRYQIGDVYP